MVTHGSPENAPPTQQYKASNHWETLEIYLVSVFNLLKLVMLPSFQFLSFLRWKRKLHKCNVLLSVSTGLYVSACSDIVLFRI